MAGSEIAILVLAELWIVTAAGAALLFYLNKKAKHNIAELRAALKMSKNNVDDYDHVIRRELERTKQRLRNLLKRDRPPGEAMLVTRLRANFLSAEQHARAYQENQEAFWTAIEEGLKDIIALAKLKVEQTSGDERDAWQQKLEQSEQKIKELACVKKTSSPLRAETPEASALATELEQLRELKVQHLEKIEKLITDIAVLRSTNLNSGLAKSSDDAATSAMISATLPLSDAGTDSTPVFIRSMQEVKYAQSAMADTLQQIDIYQANSSRELSRLKEMCMEQRSIIKELRRQLKPANGQESLDQDDVTIQQTDRIERLLRDAEMCVMTLEQENANLQSEISTLRSQANVPDEPALMEHAGTPESDLDMDGQKSLEYYHKQIQQFRARIKQQDEAHRVNQQLRYFITKAVECQTTKSFTELLSLTLSQFSLSGCMQLKTGERTVSATFGNNVDSKDSNLLNSIIVEAAVTPLAENTVYAFKPLKVLLKQKDARRERPLASEHISELLELSARLLDLLLSKEKQLIDNGERQKFATSVKKSLNNIQIQFKYQGDESRRVAETMVEDLKIAMSILSISDAEEQRTLDIIEEANKRLNILVTNGRLIDKSINGLLSSIDEAMLNTH